MRGLCLALSFAVAGCAWHPSVSETPRYYGIESSHIPMPGQKLAVAIIKQMTHEWVDENIRTSDHRVAHAAVNNIRSPHIFWADQRCPNMKGTTNENRSLIWYWDKDEKKYQCVSGVTWGWHAIFVSKYANRLSETSLAHEFAHNYRRELLGDSDPTHGHLDWWKYYDKTVNKVIRWHEEPKMSTYDHFKTDNKIEQDGVWVDYGDAGRYRVARIGGANKKFSKLYTKLTRPYRRAMDTGTLSEKVTADLLRRCFVEASLIGWDGVTGEDGEELKYSREAALKLFTDLPDLFTDLIGFAQEKDAYLASLREEDAKN